MSPQSFVVTNALRNSVRPALLLPFAQSGVVDPRITFTRASSATYFNSQGVLTTAANNVPRIDYDPLTGACLGLLIEEGRTNGVRNGYGSGGTASVLPTYWSAPANGSVTNGLTVTYGGPVVNQGIPAYRFTITGTATASGAFSFVYENGGGALTNLAVSTSFQQNVYVAIASGSSLGTWTHWGQLRDSTLAVVADNQQQLIPTTTMTRFNTSQTTPSSGNAPFGVRSAAILYYYTTGSVQNLTFDIGCGQQEIGAFPTSFIATTGASATRTLEYATIPLGSWYNASAFSLLVEAQKNTSADTGFGTPVELNDGTAARTTTFYNNPSSALLRFASPTSDTLSAGTYTLATPYKAAGAITGTSTTTGTIAASLNGATTVTGTTTNFDSASYTNMNIGFIGAPGAGNQMNGWIQRIAYYPVAFSNTQLQAMSS
jgi:hypothetical protein